MKIKDRPCYIELKEYLKNRENVEACIQRLKIRYGTLKWYQYHEKKDVMHDIERYTKLLEGWEFLIANDAERLVNIIEEEL